jgi:uncharacterized Zn-binding protein involved in type VI secretion
MPLDAHAVGRVIAHGAGNARAAVHAAGPHKAIDVWSHTAAGIGHQGSTDLLHLPDSGFSSTPLSDVPGALKMQAGDLGGAIAEIGNAQGALATTGAVFGALIAAEQTISTLVSAIPFPAFPAVRVMDFDVGLPHAHNHPPNLIPPAPPVPLPSTGPVIAIPYVSGAATVLINGMPAGRCGDVGMGIWCGGFFPMFEIFLGSSSVWIEGARSARIGVDITKHCTFSAPKPSDPPMGPMIGTTVSASPNVIIGGVPMPSLTAMAVGAAMKVAFKGLGKLFGAIKKTGIFSRAGNLPRELAYLSEADPARRVLGPARLSHAEEIAAMRRTMEEAGVEVRERPGAMAYAPGVRTGEPGQFIIDPDASYSAWLHEYQHFADDQAAGWGGFRDLYDNNTRWQRESAAYNKEIELMEGMGHHDVADDLRSLRESERSAIYGEEAPEHE